MIRQGPHDDGMSDLAGCVTAGSSTFAGFLCLQSVQNVLLPRGANWLDPVQLDSQSEATLKALGDETKLTLSEINSKVDAILAKVDDKKAA